MPISPALINRITQITSKIARTSGDRINPAILIHRARSTGLTQRLNILKTLSFFLLLLIIVMIFVVLFAYWSLPDEPKTLSSQELRKIIEDRIQEEVHKKAHLLEHNDLAVTWAVENPGIIEDASPSDLQGSRVFMSRKGSVGSTCTDFNEKGYSWAELSTTVDCDTSKATPRLGFNRPNEETLINMGRKGLISKLRFSK